MDIYSVNHPNQPTLITSDREGAGLVGGCSRPTLSTSTQALFSKFGGAAEGSDGQSRSSR